MRQYRNADLDQTKEFKDTLKEAHDYATTLPGGELSVEEQEEVIQMLEQLKERKKCVFHFLTRVPTHLEVRIGDSLLSSPRRLAAYRPPRQTSRWRSTRPPPHPHDAFLVFHRSLFRPERFMHCDRAYLSILRPYEV